MSPAELTAELAILASRLRGIANRIDAFPSLADGTANSRQAEAEMRAIAAGIREGLQHAKSLAAALYLVRSNQRGTDA